MSKTWYGHHIETIKGEDYVLHKDYTELQNKLDNEIERLNNIINGIDDIIKNHYIVGYTVQNSSIDSILKEIKQLKESDNND